MLPDYLQNFNEALQKFQDKFPKGKWSSGFKESLINDYSFYSAKIEDEKLHYGDYSWVSEKNINRHFDEFCYRINRSQSKDTKFNNLIKRMVKANSITPKKIICT